MRSSCAAVHPRQVASRYLLVSLWRPIDNLGVLITPLAALTLLLDWLRPLSAPVALTSQLQALHILVALVAYSLLCLAAVQSIMLLAQDRQVKQKHTGAFL